MVYSFNNVLKKLKADEVIVIYSDILFEKILSKIIKSKHPIATVIDKLEKNGKRNLILWMILKNSKLKF